VSYINRNGERRTTISVRLSDSDLQDLDALARAIQAERLASPRSNSQRHAIESDAVSRSDALREAIGVARSRTASTAQ
jgi:hypothetical protein